MKTDQEGLEIEKEIVVYAVRQVITLGSVPKKIKIEMMTQRKTGTKRSSQEVRQRLERTKQEQRWQLMAHQRMMSMMVRMRERMNACMHGTGTYNVQYSCEL